MQRKDLLMEVETPERPVLAQSEKKLSDVVDEAASYLNLLETRGWKLLMKAYIDPRSSIERILSQPGGRSRDEATAAVAELIELMKYINTKIGEGQKANEQLEILRRNNRK